MAWGRRRFRRGGFRRSFRRSRTRTRYVIRGYSRRRRSYGGGGLRLTQSHKKMLAGALIFFVLTLFVPRVYEWCVERWVKLRLPLPKGP